MYWIETGSVNIEKLVDDPGVTSSSQKAKAIVVFEPKLEHSFARRLIATEFNGGYIIDTATNTDRRLCLWTEETKESTRVPEFWGNGGLSDLAEEIGKMDYDWVCFIVLNGDGTKLTYEIYSRSLPDYLEMD